MKFEEKINKIDEIITELEKDEVNLDDSINKYTEAMKLIKECDSTLKKAEEKITKLVTENGELEDFKDLEEN